MESPTQDLADEIEFSGIRKLESEEQHQQITGVLDLDGLRPEPIDDEEEPGLTVNEATLAVISTTIGAGVTSIPYAMTAAGFTTGLLINLIIICFIFFTTYLYWLARRFLQYDHLSEMLYVTLGRSSIFALNGLLAFIIYGIIVIYLTLGARICRSVLSESGVESDILQEKWPWVLGISGILFPLFMRRSLGEMTFQTKILFGGVVALILTMAQKALFQDSQIADNNALEQISAFREEKSIIENWLDSSNICMMSFGFMLNLYPIINSIKKSQQTAENVSQTIGCSVIFCFVVYTILTLLAMQIYGDGIKPSILDNFDGEKSIQASVIRLIFMTIFMCNSPYLFLPGKSFLLNIVFEWRERMFSRRLQSSVFRASDSSYLDNRRLSFMSDDYNSYSANNFRHVDLGNDSFGAVADEEGDNYKQQSGSMDPLEASDSVTHYTISVAYLALIIVTAIQIDDLTLMFGMISSFAECMLNFIVPGFILILGAWKELSCRMRIAVIFYVIFGLAYFVTSNTYNVIKIAREVGQVKN